MSPVREAAGGTETQCDHMSVNNPVWMRECVFIRVVCVEHGLEALWSLFHRKVSLSLFFFFLFFLLAGSKRGEVVAVLVLSPEAQPLLVWLLLVFGPVALPRTAYNKTDRKSKFIFETVCLDWLVAENKQEIL